MTYFITTYLTSFNMFEILAFHPEDGRRPSKHVGQGTVLGCTYICVHILEKARRVMKFTA